MRVKSNWQSLVGSVTLYGSRFLLQAKKLEALVRDRLFNGIALEIVGWIGFRADDANGMPWAVI